MTARAILLASAVAPVPLALLGAGLYFWATIGPAMLLDLSAVFCS